MAKLHPPKFTDAQSCKVLEDWTRSPDNRDVTRMPTQFSQVETSVISGMQKLLYLSEVKSSEIIVRTRSIYALFKISRAKFPGHSNFE